MALTAENLVGYLRAEFNKSGRLRVWLFVLQLVAAIPIAASVVVEDGTTLYVLAVLSSLALAVYWVLIVLYMRASGAAQAARRAALLMNAFDEKISAEELQYLKQKMTVTEAQARAAENASYYASEARPSPRRLGEAIEESAFYSADLQRYSAKVMLGIVIAFAVVFAVGALAGAPFFERTTTLIWVRILLAILVFVLSSDVIGAAIQHWLAANTLSEIILRLRAIEKIDYPLTDVLLIMTDYNTTVEGAPESVPSAYKRREKDLNQRWAEYLKDKTGAV